MDCASESNEHVLNKFTYCPATRIGCNRCPFFNNGKWMFFLGFKRTFWISGHGVKYFPRLGKFIFTSSFGKLMSVFNLSKALSIGGFAITCFLRSLVDFQYNCTIQFLIYFFHPSFLLHVKMNKFPQSWFLLPQFHQSVFSC